MFSLETLDSLNNGQTTICRRTIHSKPEKPVRQESGRQLTITGPAPGVFILQEYFGDCVAAHELQGSAILAAANGKARLSKALFRAADRTLNTYDALIVDCRPKDKAGNPIDTYNNPICLPIDDRAFVFAVQNADRFDVHPETIRQLTSRVNGFRYLTTQS